MDVYADLCSSFGLPGWIASLLHAAKHLKSGRARRKKVYRLLQRKLMYHRVGVKEGDQCCPTYIYPEEVKQLIRSVFSQDICDYPDPCHDQVVYLTLEDFHKCNIN
ncbi:coiled-coil-helix-coiled-coil-helix domain-containing protein 7 isoform 1-T1 [Spinachia spinachia]